MTLLICGSNELGEKNYEHISNDGAWCKCGNVLNLYLQNKLFTWFSFTVFISRFTAACRTTHVSASFFLFIVQM